MTEYSYKLDNFLYPLISNISNPNILELGVQNGTSTKKFLELCEKNDGFLFSADINDCAAVSSNSRWLFLKTRDDNFDYIKSQIPKKLDIVFLDSLHEAAHVEKIFYEYYEMLNVGGYFFIDDISHIPYVKNNERNSFYCEINNKETFNTLLDIFNGNNNHFELNFAFKSSGLAIIKKVSENSLNKKIQIKTREKSLKNILRLIWQNLKRA